jgi:hypothetical protein
MDPRPGERLSRSGLGWNGLVLWRAGGLDGFCSDEAGEGGLSGILCAGP